VSAINYKVERTVRATIDFTYEDLYYLSSLLLQNPPTGTPKDEPVHQKESRLKLFNLASDLLKVLNNNNLCQTPSNSAM